jgi:YD repeat-containing protein
MRRIKRVPGSTFAGIDAKGTVASRAIVKILLLLAVLLVSPTAWGQSPTITGTTPSSGPVGMAVTLTGSNFGTTQGNSTVSLGSIAAVVTNWSSNSIGVVVPTGASSGPFSVVVNGQTANSSSFTVTPLPSGWSDADVGSVGVAGSASYANGTFTVKGAGGDIYGSADAFHFAFQPLSGDGSIVARVVSLGSGGGYAKAGVMIRETLNNAGSTNAFLAYQNNSQAIFQVRTSTGGGTGQSTASMSLPYWTKVVRSGNSFSGYASPDGVNWTQVGSSQIISMAQNVYIGVALTSANNSALATATFDNVSINATAAPAPVISGVSVIAGPVVAAALAGVGSQAVISGSGFGPTQGGSQVLLNDAAVTISSWSSSSITITIPFTATSGYLVVAVAPTMNDSNAVYFTVAQVPILGWLDVDVGPVGLTGSASYANGTFTVKGSGADIFGTSDQFHFVFQPLSGDGAIVARVVSLQGGGGNKAGVMIRETLNSGSTEVDLTQYGTTVTELLWRATTGGGTNYINGSDSLPYWVKLARSGNSFSGYTTADGLNWVQVGSTQTIQMASNVYIGLAVCSINNSALLTATFDHVNLVELSATKGTLAGQVTRASDGSAVSGAQIQVIQGGAVENAVVSDSNGNYTLFNLNAGPSDIKVSASGLGSSFTPALFVRAGQVTTLNLSLSSPGTISGTVTQADGVTPIQGANLTALVGQLSGTSTTSGSNGSYSIGGLTAGAYTVQASAPGFANTTQSVAVAANSTATANFSLQTQGPGAGSYVYDPLGRLVGVILQNGNTVIYNYDAVGTLLSITRQSSSQLAILTFSPGRGPVGTTVTISGTGFSSTPSQNTVSFNGTNATVQSATATQLVVNVPTGATTGPISVTTSAGTVTSNNSFTVGN